MVSTTRFEPKSSICVVCNYFFLHVSAGATAAAAGATAAAARAFDLCFGIGESL